MCNADLLNTIRHKAQPQAEIVSSAGVRQIWPWLDAPCTHMVVSASRPVSTRARALTGYGLGIKVPVRIQSTAAGTRR